MSPSAWKPVRPASAAELSDARLQLHHAAQFGTAFGVSYLPARDDDSHTNLEWLPDVEALASNSSRGLRVAIRPRDLTVLIGDAQFQLEGKTIEQAADWARQRLAAAGFDPARYTLARHFEIPKHPVASGRAFAAKPELREVAGWIANGAMQMERLRSLTPNASDVRCWPHHFDIATLITVAPGRTVGVGLESGDAYYDEPYFYVNMHPSPGREGLGEALKGGGSWHTHDWIGAVLPGSRLKDDASAQEMQVADFLDNAVTQATALLLR